PHEHRQSARDHDRGDREDDYQDDRRDESARLPAAADRRPESPPTRYHARADPPRVGTESPPRGRSRQNDRVLSDESALIASTARRSSPSDGRRTCPGTASRSRSSARLTF